MKKTFNITGVCYPQLHYMMDNSQKLDRVMALVEQGAYFTINRPRQYGKTTTLYFLAERLKQSTSYLPIALNFQGIDDKWHESDEAFAQIFIRQLINALKPQSPDLAAFLKEKSAAIEDMDSLSELITALIHKVERSVVLLVDEVDASSNYFPFLKFLGMLRTKFLARMQPQHATFFSVVLAGVHDIKSLKYKLRDSEAAQYNSPWNIAADFEVEMSFNPAEIAPMLADYCAAERVTMEIPAIAERLWYHTSGHPFLVSKLCKNIAEKILPQRTIQDCWTLDDVEEATRLLLRENNTNFDGLIKNLENHQDLYDLVFRIVIDGAAIAFNQYNATIHQGVLYGIFKRNGNVRIHNRIYEQLIYDFMTSNLEVKMKTDAYNFENQFVLPGNQLDVQKILLKFQQFLNEQYSVKDQDFLERHWRLVFLAFVKPIINGKGYDFKEVQISQERRLDVVITYLQHKYIVELKRWYGEAAHQEGLTQLADYLDRQYQTKGYLVIFDDRKEKAQTQQTIEHQGKEIFAIWV
ncbi:MAG: AAA-like domain-containing protein [Saprospiraceae bacterium]